MRVCLSYRQVEVVQVHLLCMHDACGGGFASIVPPYPLSLLLDIHLATPSCKAAAAAASVSGCRFAPAAQRQFGMRSPMLHCAVTLLPLMLMLLLLLLLLLPCIC
jgi:hypothetical protein